jgi:hypothetical protein
MIWFSKSRINEIIVPAGLQVGIPYMYQDGYRNMITRLMEGDISQALDNPTYMGTIGSVLAKKPAIK